MTDANNFILTSDYATLKNDSVTTAVSVVVPGSQAVAANTVYSVSADITLGKAGSIVRAQIASSKDSNLRYVATSINYGRTGTVGGAAAAYTVAAVLTRISGTTIRLTAYIVHPYGSTLTGAAGAETITFYVTTFLSPYS